MAWDVQLPQLLYAATVDGIISVYNSKTRSRQPNQGPHKNETRMVTHCKIVTTIEGHQAGKVALTPMKGCLFSASPSLFAAHNVSGMYARTRDEVSI